MDENKQCLLNMIQEARFACVELNLYLDTHPDDEAAKADFNCYANKLCMLTQKYERQYGPLMNFGSSSFDVGSWVFQKWAWDR